MTNEELLAKYLDDSLSESERAEFAKLANTSPEFARDVHELSKIEGFLQEGPVIAAAVPEDFLASVENHITGKIHHDKYHTPGAGNTFTKVLSAFWAVPVILILGIGGFFLLRDSHEQQQASQSQSAPPPVIDENSAQYQPGIQIQPQISDEPKTNMRKAPAQERNFSQPQNNAVPEQPVHKPDEFKGTIDNSGSSSENTVFEKTREKLNTAHAEGKKAIEAALLKQMGMLAAKMGNTTEARTYLNDAINLARGIRLAGLEAESTGELGIVLKKEGNQSAAAESFRKSIELLKSSGQPAERWEKELKAVQQ